MWPNKLMSDDCTEILSTKPDSRNDQDHAVLGIKQKEVKLDGATELQHHESATHSFLL